MKHILGLLIFSGLAWGQCGPNGQLVIIGKTKTCRPRSDTATYTGNVSIGATSPAGGPGITLDPVTGIASNGYKLQLSGRSATIVPLGDSLTAFGSTSELTPTSWVTWLVLRSGGAFRLLKNAGIGGNTTAQMLARLDADVIAYHPKYCSILGGTNDLGTGVAIATTKANLTAIVDKLAANGVTPILLTVPPRTDISYAQSVAQLNHEIKDIGVARGAAVVDISAPLTNPATGSYIAAYTSDGVHFTQTGAALVGETVQRAMNIPVATSPEALPSWSGDTGNLADNGLFVTDTNGDGVPDDWSVGTNTSSGSSFALTSDTDIRGNWWVINKPSVTGAIVITGATKTTGFSVGDRVAFAGRIWADVTNAMTYSVYLERQGASRSLTPISSVTVSTPKYSTFYADEVIPSGTTGLRVVVSISSGAGTLRLAQLGAWNLTTRLTSPASYNAQWTPLSAAQISGADTTDPWAITAAGVKRASVSRTGTFTSWEATANTPAFVHQATASAYAKFGWANGGGTLFAYDGAYKPFSFPGRMLVGLSVAQDDGSTQLQVGGQVKLTTNGVPALGITKSSGADNHFIDFVNSDAGGKTVTLVHGSIFGAYNAADNVWLWYGSPTTGDVTFPNRITNSALSGTGNAFACLDSTGKLYRSATACN